ncbi:mannitol dehydrogenase family protein [Microbacterium sp.]|uniref:mannitol dehydrogenase family protein n=1 Tax=Microbacterium sp. TaxID=51671 RepID=UPI003A8AEE77
MTPVPLTRAALAARGAPASAAPVRIVHLGLGHFFRAHQAWFTARAADAHQWGIAAFTGRSRHIADDLTAQDGLFTLVERGPDGDRVEVVTSVSEAATGTDLTRLAALVSDPAVAIITLTVTESGYRLHADGTPDPDDADLAADLRALGEHGTGAEPGTVLGRLVYALAARRSAAAGPIAVVPCDNIPDNGAFLARGVTVAAARVDPSLAEWVRQNVSFVSTSVDRITPHAEAPDAVADAGWTDTAAVVTEPFADWVLAGRFPAGRPDWVSAGARCVDDIEPWENRKLWLLNGAHSILTFAGLPRGLTTVAEAMADAQCRALVESFWDEAVRCLPDDADHVAYRAQLRERFANPRIVHRLEQISVDATVKVQVRIAAVAERTLAAGRAPEGTVLALASWIGWVCTDTGARDARTDEVVRARDAADPVLALIALVSPVLAADAATVARVRAAGAVQDAASADVLP